MMKHKEQFDSLIDQASSTKDKLLYAGLFLFSQKGYANVGIRELCRTVGIKESSFYNHYKNKENLLEAIISYFDQTSNQVIMSEDEILFYIEKGDIRRFFMDNMQRFSSISSNLLYHTALQIVLTEAFFHPLAASMAQKNMYHLRKEYTVQVLKGMMEKGVIRRCNPEAVTAEYYYALKGMLDEYLLLSFWKEDMTEIEARIFSHIDFFTQYLTPSIV